MLQKIICFVLFIGTNMLWSYQISYADNILSKTIKYNVAKQVFDNIVLAQSNFSTT